jgi:hypothetical protein
MKRSAIPEEEKAVLPNVGEHGLSGIIPARAKPVDKILMWTAGTV